MKGYPAVDRSPEMDVPRAGTTDRKSLDEGSSLTSQSGFLIKHKINYLITLAMRLCV